MRWLSLGMLLACSAAAAAQSPSAWQWHQAQTPAAVVSVAFAELRPGLIFAGTDRGLLVSSDDGRSWRLQPAPLQEAFVWSLAAVGDSLLYIGTDGAGVLAYDLPHNRWLPSAAGLTTPFVTALAVHPAGFVFAGTDGGGLFRLAVNDSVWQRLRAGDAGQVIKSLAVSPTGKLFAGTFGAGILVSTNLGKNWTLANSGLLHGDVRSITFDERGYVFSSTAGGGIFKSAPGTLQWQEVSNGLLDRTVWSLAAAPNLIMAATASGPFASTDAGKTWRDVSGNLTQQDTRAVFVTASGRVLLGSIQRRIFWSQPAAVSGARENGAQGPHRFALRRVFPNPSAGKFQIELDVQQRAELIVYLYSEIGRRIFSARLGEIAPGRHRFSIPAARLASGVYFLRVEARLLPAGEILLRTRRLQIAK